MKKMHSSIDGTLLVKAMLTLLSIDLSFGAPLSDGSSQDNLLTGFNRLEQSLNNHMYNITKTLDKFVNMRHTEKLEALSEYRSILVQQHYGGSSFFARTWNEFKDGFGDVTSNYWIGNDRLHQLTKDGRYKLRVDLEIRSNSSWYWAEYTTFRVWDESTQYRLVVGGYSGTAGDSLIRANGAKFSTRDRDNDNHSDIHCAQNPSYGNGGGFWYDSCSHVFINSPLGNSYGNGWCHINGCSTWNDANRLHTSRLTLQLKY